MIQWSDVLSLADNGNPPPPRRDERTPQEWQNVLDAEQFRVTRESGTEAPHSSPMCTVFEPGRYDCVCCGTTLFDSETKFDSGTGWPSFNAPLADNVVAYTSDRTYGMHRVEVTCNICDAHLGHVFPDGPPPSGLRFCINAVALSKSTA